MQFASRVCVRVFSCLVVLFLLAGLSFSEVHTSAQPQIRVTTPVDNNKRTTLYGHVPRALQHASKLGTVAPGTQAEHLILLLKSGQDQERELRRVLDEQQDKHTQNFHQWVTPEEFGAHFGVHDNDIQAITSWLTSQGLTVEKVNKSKRAIRFSGTIGQIEKAFQTELDYYLMPNGETHVAPSREISIPSAFSGVISGIPTLNDFFRKSHLQEIGRYSRLKAGPKYTVSTSTHYVSAGDFATIYNTAPLLAQGITGAGETIAIVGRSDILLSDVQSYRQLSGLPPNDPNFIHAGQDAGTLPGDDGESDLDVEISGGVAPGATVDFVIGTPTFLVDGITNSTEYIIENNIADVMSVSYGDCEVNEGAGGNAFNSQMYEQAAAQGTSIFIAAGDNGPAECDDSNDSYEVLGYAAPAEASTWYSVAAGGSEFDEGSNVANYWSTTNSGGGSAINSALTYIPEVPWNEASKSSYDPTGEDLSGLWSGSGGISAYYLQPPWQRGSGVPTTDPALTLATGATGLWVTGITITNPGSGYTTAPTMTLTGGGCLTEPYTTGAVTISGGAISGIVFPNDGAQGGTLHVGQGFGCTSAPTIAFTAAPAGGTTATATATVGPMQNPAPLISGVPHRYTPDLALNAASDHDGTIFCSEGVCEISSTGTAIDFGLVGGTSVAAPSMAGIQALIDQANGGRQGMPGYIYYSLANSQNASACNSSGPPAPGSNCAFQDITTGNNFICGESSCTSGGASEIGFKAATGYDMATGLGSPNAANLASQWSSVTFNSSNATLSLSQTSFQHGTSINLSGTVAPGSGSGTPTGDVAFIVSQGAIGDTNNENTGAQNGPVAFATLSGGSYSATLNNLPGGTYYVTARYGGDETYASSLSTPVQVTVSQEGSGVTITPYSLNGSACEITSGSSFTYGSDILVNLNVAGVSGAGAPTGTVALSLDGNQIASLPLDPNGNAFTLSGAITSSSCIYDYDSDNVNSFAVGNHTLTASYSGDGTYTASTATPVAITVSQNTSTLTLSAGSTVITSGFSDNLVATFGGLTAINGNSTLSAAPTGTVTFTDTTTSTVLGTAPVISSALFSGNNYTFSAYATVSTTGITTTGANSITATYSGDANWAPLTSAAVTVTVSTGTATTTAVTSSGNPTTLNGRPTFTATVTTATAGSVIFYDGTAVLGTGSAVGSAHTSTFRPASGAAFWGGTHNITAAYSGSGTTMASTSPVFVETVTQGTNTIALTAKTVGTSSQVYALAAVLTPSTTSGAFAPNQSVVNFFDGATNIGAAQPLTVTSTQGGYGLWTATLTVNLSAGTHNITATYSDINYSPATSNAQTITVGGAQTISFTSAAPSSAVYGTNFSVAATATSGLAVAYTSYGACTNVGSTYTMSNGTGSCLVIANQSGNGSYGAAPEVTETVSATEASQTINCTGLPSSASYGSNFTASCTATSNLAITYTSSGSCTNSGATYTMTSGAGSCSVIANQPGNGNYTAAAQVTNAVSATKGVTSINVTSVSPAAEDYAADAPVTITAVLSYPGSAAPTGAVTIGGNGPSGYGATSCGAASGGTVTCSATYTPTTADTPGSYTETASVAGDSNYNGSSSSQSNNFAINIATSTTTVTSTPNPSTYAQQVTFTATIAGENNFVKGNTARRNGVKSQDVTGTVTWSSNTGCSASTVSGNPGIATCVTSSSTRLPVGTDTVTATYSGDSNHSGSTGSVSQVVNGGIATSINVTSVSPTNEDFAADTPVTITAELTWTGHGAEPTTSDITIGGTGSGTYSATSCAARVSDTITCTATYTPTNLDVAGSYNETATFSGDTNYAGSTSPQTGNFTINSATSSTAVTSSVNPASSGQSVTFTATITGENNFVKGQARRNGVKSQDVTGTVAWSVNTGCGTTAVSSGNPGVATCTTTSLPEGTDTVTATYSGDSNHGGSSGNFVESINANSQTIMFSMLPPSSASYSSSFTVAATASSGLPVAFTSAGSCSNMGTTYTMTSGTGTCSVIANQAGNSTYGAAPTVTYSVNATKATPSVTFMGLPSSLAFANAYTLTATTNASTTAVISNSTPAVCSLTGSVVTIVADAGTCTVTAQWAADSNYTSATRTQSGTATKGVPVITWGTPAPINYGTALSATQLDATANQAGSFRYSPASGKIEAVGNVTLTATFTPTDKMFAVTTATVTLQVLQAPTTTTVTSSDQTVTLRANGTATATVKSNVTSYKPTGSVTLTASTGEVCSSAVVSGTGNASCILTFTSTGPRTITAAYGGDANHTGSNNSTQSPAVTVTVNPHE